MSFVDGAESLDGCGGRLEKGGGLLSGFAGNFWVATGESSTLFSIFLFCFVFFNQYYQEFLSGEGRLRVRRGFHFEAYTWQMAFHAFLHVASGFFTCLIVGVKWLSTWLLGRRCKKTDPPHFLVNDRMT